MTTRPGPTAAAPTTPKADPTDDSVSVAALDSFLHTPNPRLREVMAALTRHAHEFVREVEPSLAEWQKAIEFLTQVGQTCTETRQEFILLSDVLGISMLVETLNAQPGGTDNTVLGPFHMTQSPQRVLGETIDLLGGAQPCVVSGRVTTDDGTSLPGATLDVWQCSKDGFYDVQQPGIQPSGNGRGIFTADAEGRYWFRTVVPSHYPVPTDGPVGHLLQETARHPYRPAHIHFIVSAPGFSELTTHAFVAGSPYIDSDAVFAVKQSLVVDFTESHDPTVAAAHGVEVPFIHAQFDIELQKSP
ncbi:dioxygenase [Mycobacterium sp. AT1]|uniref:dioxygenase family protein n=1 Tax=Mycobacterium sp. AT1 TaxID=1961706 RepID=UPI0009AD791F|nr:6-chlorohydroxyquinol-1,2-dioxygenase [Mycobacterium sp. AT1]